MEGNFLKIRLRRNQRHRREVYAVVVQLDQSDEKKGPNRENKEKFEEVSLHIVHGEASENKQIHGR